MRATKKQHTTFIVKQYSSSYFQQKKREEQKKKTTVKFLPLNVFMHEICQTSMNAKSRNSRKISTILLE